MSPSHCGEAEPTDKAFSYSWCHLGRITRQLVSVQAAVIASPSTGHLLTSALPHGLSRFILQEPYVAGTIITPISQMGKLRLTEVEELASSPIL